MAKFRMLRAQQRKERLQRENREKAAAKTLKRAVGHGLPRKDGFRKRENMRYIHLAEGR